MLELVEFGRRIWDKQQWDMTGVVDREYTIRYRSKYRTDVTWLELVSATF